MMEEIHQGWAAIQSMAGEAEAGRAGVWGRDGRIVAVAALFLGEGPGRESAAHIA
jgi:hypothetical protein